ncbi:MAG: hypothetical protein QF768_02160, partial [Candidatus Latescibacteria bacterium]|nr:hypothetical protein [Candidatus Latescibacterota bacterium]
MIAADAQSTVQSVTISSPDSGAVKGIDSTFTVVAVVEDFTTEDSDGILFYLIVGNDSTVVADTDGNDSDTALNGTDLDDL